MTGLLVKMRRLNGVSGRPMAEPFAGGTGASLSMLLRGETAHIYINDADPSIHDFWWTLVHRPKPFLELLGEKRVSMAEWHRQRDLYRCSRRHSRLRRGFAAFYLNRCNRSGIVMNGGPIGGIEQTGKWKLGARFDKENLQLRCKRIAEYRASIHVSQLDGMDFIRTLDAEDTFFFIDPPYFEKGPTLYLNALDRNYHAALADHLWSMRDKAWVLTYDDCQEVRRLYQKWASIHPFSLKYVAADRRSGKEILITPKWMRLPSSQESAVIDW